MRLEIPNELLVRAVTDAVARHLDRINEFSGYVDMKGACKFLSVGETQFKAWVKLGFIHQRKVSSHLVRFRINDLCDFMEQFKIERLKQRQRVGPAPSSASGRTTHGPAAQ